MAGGRAFLAPPGALSALAKVDPARVLNAPAGATPPTAAVLRPGTLFSTRAVNGSATIYVAGTDGELHGFSTSHQFFADGYDAALVVTVPSLDGLRVGATDGVAGAAMTALATRADGAIVDSSGTFYVFAGGRAFGISTPAELVGVQKADPAEVLVGSVGPPQRGAAIATGASSAPRARSTSATRGPCTCSRPWPSWRTTATVAPPPRLWPGPVASASWSGTQGPSTLGSLGALVRTGRA